MGRSPIYSGRALRRDCDNGDTGEIDCRSPIYSGRALRLLHPNLNLLKIAVVVLSTLDVLSDVEGCARCLRRFCRSPIYSGRALRQNSVMIILVIALS